MRHYSVEVRGPPVVLILIDLIELSMMSVTSAEPCSREIDDLAMAECHHAESQSNSPKSHPPPASHPLQDLVTKSPISDND